jgi:hypothetical protein
MRHLFRPSLLFAVSTFVTAALLALQADQPPAAQPPRVPGAEPIGVTAPIDEIRRVVGAVRAGRRLTPAWPNGARVAVALSFDVDNELLSRNSPLPVPSRSATRSACTDGFTRTCQPWATQP